MPTKDPQPLAGPIQTGQPTITPLTPLVGPTVKSELLIMEYVDTEGPAYQILAYGAPYPDATKYPGYQLTLQRPVDHKIIQRFWTTDRISQELYNFALSYLSESLDHSVYVRSLVLPLPVTPLALWTPDPQDAAAILVHQEQKGWGEDVPPEIANLYRLVIRVYHTLPGPLLHGSKFNPLYLVSYPTTEQLVQSGTVPNTTPGTEIEPVSKAEDKVTTYDLAAIQLALSKVFWATPGTANIEVPPVLDGISVEPVKGQGAGVTSSSGSGSSSGQNWGYQLKADNTSEANASSVLEFLPLFRYPWGRNKPVQDYFLLIPGPTVTEANVLALLLANFLVTVSPWPDFDPQPVVFLAQGQNIRLSAGANANVTRDNWANDTASGNSQSAATGTSQSYTVENILKVYEYQPALRGLITLSASETQTATATADVVLDSNEAGPVSLTQTATAQVDSSFAATTITDWPSSGLYLLQIESELTEFQMMKIRARVFDFSKFR